MGLARDRSTSTKWIPAAIVAGIALVVAATTLLLVHNAFRFNNAQALRLDRAKNLSQLASIVGINCGAALDFNDPASATELLSSLKQQPSVCFACVYDVKGNVFAAYRVKGESKFAPPPPGEIGSRFTEDGFLDITQEIVSSGRRVGTVYLHSSMADLNQLD